MGSTGDAISIMVIGAGISGLAAALSLSQQTHTKITILESKPALNEFGASIAVQPQSTRILEHLGLSDKFALVISKNGFLNVRDGATNEVLGKIVQNAGNACEILYGSVSWIIHRADYQRVLAEGALEHGAEIVFDANVSSIDIEATPPAVVLEGGRRLTADLIVGADGLRSAVRTSIPATADTHPKKLFETCWRTSVSKDKMRDNPKVAWLLSIGDSMAWSCPGAYILAWPMPPDRPYDIVAMVRKESDVPPGLWGLKDDPANMRGEFQHFCSEVTELLDAVDECVKWTLAELDPLTTCRSDNGRVVLVGDAWHAMIPHSASGGNSAIEDGAVLGECIGWAIRNSRSISDATSAYEAIRKARVERMQTASHEGYGFLGAGGKEREMRDKMLKEQIVPMEEELKKPESERWKGQRAIKADMNARFPTPPYMQWLQGYDAIAEARRYLKGME